MGETLEDEMQIVEKSQENLQVFEHLYKMYFDKIYRYFYFRMNNKEDAEDLTSVTFHKAMKHIEKFHNKGFSFSSWLFRIAHNTLIDYRRTDKSSKKVSLDDLEPYNEPSTPEIPEFVEDVTKNQKIERIKNIIRAFSPLKQNIWALKISSGMTHREIARALNMSESNVNVILHRTLKIIKEQLKKS